MASTAEEPNRRDFLVIAGNAFAAVGGAIVLWPFIAQMNPDSGRPGFGLGGDRSGPSQRRSGLTAMWRGKPIFIRNRTKAEIESAKAVEISALVDPSARNMDLPESDPATDVNRTKRDMKTLSS